MYLEPSYGIVLLETEIESGDFFRQKTAVVGRAAMGSFSASSED